MNISETYDYLVRARRDLWATLEVLPDEVLTRPLLGGSRFHCIKNLLSLLDYWRRVEQSTLAYLATLTDDAMKRIVTSHDSPDERYTVDGLLWHVMIHEMRHTAQICVLLRTQDIKPPSLDLLFYLPSA